MNSELRNVTPMSRDRVIKVQNTNNLSILGGSIDVNMKYQPAN